MSYNPKHSGEMDENVVSAEIGGFVEDQLQPKAPAPKTTRPKTAPSGASQTKAPQSRTSQSKAPQSRTSQARVPQSRSSQARTSQSKPSGSASAQGKRPQSSQDLQNKLPHTTPQNHTTHKRRPKRKREYTLFGIPQLLATTVWLGLILAIGVTLGRVMWVCAADVLAFGRADKEVSVTITKDDDMDSIIAKLEENDLIRYPWLFQLYADLSGAEEDIVPGTFTLNTSYDYHALVNEMSSSASKREEVVVQIPEGYSCRQIFKLLEDKGVATVEELEAYAAEGDLGEYWFLEGLERGDKYCLEGFLFPDTYNFYTSGGPEHALRKLLNGFENQFSQDLQEQLTILNDHLADKMRANGNSEEFVAENMFTVREVIIVASLIEKEAANNVEMPNIASVIYNRLFSWGSTPRYLNIDAAIVYALDGKTDLTLDDLAIDHPYNTYKNTGLTPGPITNPGMASIKSALNPADTGYYYYVLNPETGEHTFSRTYDEHVSAGG